MSIKREKRIVERMIRLYCRKLHGGNSLCENCSKLLAYASLRLDKCPHGDKKPTCQKCTIHCYRKEEREQIRQIMRYAGPRMIIYHPFEAIRHALRKCYDIFNR